MNLILRMSGLAIMGVLWVSTAPMAQAGTNGFIVPSFRGTPDSQAGYWETFSTPFGLPANPPDRAGATTGAQLRQTDTNAFLTGSGNIYNLNAASSFVVSDDSPSYPLSTVVLQTRTLGSEIDYNSVTLVYTNESGFQFVAPSTRVELNRGNQPGLGATVSYLFQWDLTGRAVPRYQLLFRAAEASMSFDSLTLDTYNQFVSILTTPFQVNDTVPAIERWNYANNGAPCDRPAGSVFGTMGDEAGVDTRHAQHLLGFDTASTIPAHRGPSRYLLSRCRVTLTINRGGLFAYDPTQDDYRTYFEDTPGYRPDSDVGRPVELFGVGWRNGFDVATFDQCAAFGSNATGERNAYAAGWSTNGVLVDVSNNVGKTNPVFPPFEVAPFSIGQISNVVPGQLVPAGTKVTFDLNLEDPFVLAYVQAALDDGRLRLMVSSLHTSAGQVGAPSYPDFATHFNEAIVEPTRLEIQGVVVSDGDIDKDGLLDDWERFELGTLTWDGAADPDGDGASNIVEYRTGTHPSRATSALKLLPDLAQTASGQTLIRFPHAANHHYTVEYTEAFDRWVPLPGAPQFELGTGLASWPDASPAPGERFYRVRVD